MSLYRAETRRLVKRRFTKLFVLGAILVLAAVAAGVFLTNEKVGPKQVAAAQERARADYQQTLTRFERERQDCVATQGADSATCQGFIRPSLSDFDPQWYMPATFDFRKQFPGMVTTWAALLVVVAFVIGASFVGAEWNSGGMMNLLLWRPQRVRVLATKLTALLVWLTALAVVLGAAWTGAFVLIAELRGTTAGMTAGAWQSTGLLGLRALAMVVVAGALGFGLASIGRHTATALGVAVGVIVVFQFGLGAVLNLADVKFADAYLIPFWVIAWLEKSYQVQDYNSCDFDASSGCQPDAFTITWQMAGGALAGVFVLIVVASLWTMRSRDIT